MCHVLLLHIQLAVHLPFLLAVATAGNFCEPARDPWDICNDPDRKNFLVADPTSCQIFYSCVPAADSGYTPHKLECQEGLGFNENLGNFGQCDYEDNVPRCSCQPRPVCQDGWTQAGDSCYFLSRTKISTFAAARDICWSITARLAQISSQEENDMVVGMALDAMIRGNDGLDYWIGGQEGSDGWEFEGGAPMEYSNWWGGSPDGEAMGSLKGGCIQLLRKGLTKPKTLDTFYWARANTNDDSTSKDGDNGYICQKTAI